MKTFLRLNTLSELSKTEKKHFCQILDRCLLAGKIFLQEKFKINFSKTLGLKR